MNAKTIEKALKLFYPNGLAASQYGSAAKTLAAIPDTDTGNAKKKAEKPRASKEANGNAGATPA